MGSNPGDTFNQMRPPVTMPGYHTGREPANKGKKRHLRCLPPPGLRPDSPRKQGEKFQGRPMKASYLIELLPRLARQAGIQKRVHAHGLRHTHAYELMMEGVEIPIIQRQLGHVSLATTSIYLNHIAPRQVIEAMRKRDWQP
jgi:integrase